MDFVGVIEAKPDPPGIDRAKWLTMISSRDDLVPPQPRKAANPFTAEPVTLFAPETSAELIVNGKHVGLLEWAETEENFLVVWGDLAIARHAAEQIAVDLGASFRTAANLEAGLHDLLTSVPDRKPWWKFW